MLDRSVLWRQVVREMETAGIDPATPKAGPVTASAAAGTQPVFGSVQYLRAVAAFMVLLYHALGRFHFIQEGAVRPHWLSAGVDIFFVISGFVMVVSTDRRKPSGPRFFKERVARIVPLYWLVTGVFLLIMAAQRRALPDPGEIAKSLFFLFYTNPRTHEPSPIITAGWTLNYEMLFYLVFACLLWLPTMRRIAVMAALFLCLTALRPFVPHDNAFLFRMSSPHPLEFVAGMVLAQMRHRLLALPPALGPAAILAGFVGLALIDSPFTRVVHFGPCAVAIAAGTIICEQMARRTIAPLKLLGDASYSLYLTHPLLLELLPLPAVTMGLAARLGSALATILASTLLALAFYRGFELPTIHLFRRRLRGRPVLAAVA
jgi:exopolysaccharide production protein ExoZ